MIVYRKKLYSGYSEAQPSGASYIGAQVVPVIDSIESISAPKTKKVTQGVRGSLELAGIIPSKEDYIKAEAALGASKGLKFGKKVAEIVGSDSGSSFPSRVVTLIGSGIGAGIGSVRGYIKHKNKKSKEDGITKTKDILRKDQRDGRDGRKLQKSKKEGK